MLKTTIIVLLCLALAVNCQVPAKKPKRQKKLIKCTSQNIKKAKCAFNRGTNNGCIPQIRKVNFNQYEVKPTYMKVTWDRVASAKCYYVEVLVGNTGIIWKTISCVKGTSFTVTGLQPWTTYGVQVSVVNKMCKRGAPSPTVRIRTYWAPTAATTRAPRPTYSPKVGKCGSRFFTCKSKKKQCIPKKKWCDRIKHCRDGSDERNCPGGCPELKINFKNGNYSCSRWGSPGSHCFFDCTYPYRRDGKRYTACNREYQKWTNPIPVCRLPDTQLLKVLPEETTATSITLEWVAVNQAVRYSFQAIEQSAHEDDMEFVKTQFVNATECCKTTLTDLKPGVEYRTTMWAIDEDGERGLESLPVFSKSVPQPEIRIKSG